MFERLTPISPSGLRRLNWGSCHTPNLSYPYLSGLPLINIHPFRSYHCMHPYHWSLIGRRDLKPNMGCHHLVQDLLKYWSSATSRSTTSGSRTTSTIPTCASTSRTSGPGSRSPVASATTAPATSAPTHRPRRCG